MIKEYSQNRSNVIMNFSLKYCETKDELLSSKGFKKVLTTYISYLHKKDLALYDKITYLCGDVDVTKKLITLFKLLLVLDKREISVLNNGYKNILNQKDVLFELIEGLYSHWRKLERYALIQSGDSDTGIQNINFIEASNNFLNLVLKTYRKIEENVLGYQHSVYRQLSAGINAGVVLADSGISFDEELEVLNGIQYINQIILTPPFVIYPKKNKRSGIFQEVFENPIKDLPLNKSHYFCYPAKVGKSLAFIYFHRNYMNHGISLCNLFEMAKPEEYKYKKPNLVYVFGQRLDIKEKKTVFYHERKGDTYIGFTAMHDEIDYFGYMKKMILTLHNVRMIDQNKLPIHGAMVNVTLRNGKQANIAIIGDSGAGKSESLEAFRKLSEKYLKEIKIVFDDMGSFEIENSKVYGYGTETGAFVRLDDLEGGYAFKAMDRGIFMNPNKINARLLVPVSTYADIIKGYKVDILLYANNYENKKYPLSIIADKEKAVEIFKQGLRKAKGTTTEKGLVESYFANPFGVVQRKDQVELLIEKVFSNLYNSKVEVGILYTKLGIEGLEQKGPEKAAKELFEWIMN